MKQLRFELQCYLDFDLDAVSLHVTCEGKISFKVEVSNAVVTTTTRPQVDRAIRPFDDTIVYTATEITLLFFYPRYQGSRGV